jgi:alpha-glucosidase (family GH31 glycosyl hydrolase)
MRAHLSIIAATTVFPILGSFWPMALAGEPSTVTREHVRFQSLADNVIRIEFSPKGKFVDEASVAVIGRGQCAGTPIEATEREGWLRLSAGKMTIKYQLGSGAFATSNLLITWNDQTGRHEWKPGDKDECNLGGVPASLDNRSMRAVTEPGPLSRSGYYLLDDSRSALFDKDASWVKPRPEKDSQDWYFIIYGNDYARALKRLSQLTGPVPMLPRYCFGSWFGSRAGYSADQWKMIVQQFRDEALPLDVLVLDSDSTTKVVWAGYEWDREQMPDPKEFFHWMRERGVKVTVNEHYGPLTRENDDQFETIRKGMNLPEDTKEIAHNLADKKYAELFMDVLHKPALDDGMAFWWQDGAAGASMDGLDPLLWTRHVEYEGSQRITGRRTTAFCRLGPAIGSHRYGVFFTGDLHGIWESLPVLIPATIRGGNQMVPYMNNLCGGVFTVDLPVELYRRWVQFGAFSPVIWFHGLWGLRLPWEYGPEGIETYRTFVGLRYALLPYIYTYSRIAHDTGLPLVRGTYLEFPDQEAAYANDQQYLFGRELLVAPVTQPGDGRPVRREVFLPAGCAWFDHFTGDMYEGGRSIIHECPIERMPLFVRAGSILPMGRPMDYSDQAAVDPLTLDVYAGPKPAEFRLYEDDGLSLDYSRGAHAWTPCEFRNRDDAGRYTLSIGPAQGQYKGQLETRRYVIQVHGLLRPKAVALNDAVLTEIEPEAGGDGWWWDAKARMTCVRLATPLSTARPVTVTLSDPGVFADALALQKALNLRQQVRQAKRCMKLKHAELLQGADLSKPPRVIRITEAVESRLTDAIDHPKGAEIPDFEALRKRVLDALTDQPFESNRTIPETDADSIAATKKIENAQFSKEELHKIQGILRGASLPAWLHP